MVNIILGIGAILIVVILFMIFRVGTLISVVRGTHKKRVDTSNRINAALFLVFFIVGGFAAVWSSFSASEFFLPQPSSAHGKDIDDLFWISMGVIGAVFVATHILLFYFPFKYQYKEGRVASFYPDNNKLEVVWTIIPAIVLTLLVLSGWKVWRDITADAPENSEVVEVMGKQWNWLIRYPGKDKQMGSYNFRLIDATNEYGMDFADEKNFDDFTAPVMYLPKGKPVLFKIRARDVLHSVFVPHFRLKMDAVPGMPTRFWFTPTKTTQEMRDELNNPKFNYEMACTEICGRAHFSMRFQIVVVEEAEYNKWYAEQQSWLSKNRDYMAKVPANLKEKALKVIGPEGGEPAAGDATSATDSQPVPAEVPVNPNVVTTKSNASIQ
ncbi:cytochrome c oxidase subunit II [Rhodocytophaga rosea]|uniref:Cytochrome c oxidase subunit 2 n=1 Tax=Rhodocytophaga rosea TaxID=2704465 RepID=A0A6C0GF81_9BACT|nr:cytochrome c oxidase subunit II [Rhodocytophaga rosea]QHT66608.1 cytochrome c oxidase subunit II [Rhodocytophaga rosea]